MYTVGLDVDTLVSNIEILLYKCIEWNAGNSIEFGPLSLILIGKIQNNNINKVSRNVI